MPNIVKGFFNVKERCYFLFTSVRNKGAQELLWSSVCLTPKTGNGKFCKIVNSCFPKLASPIKVLEKRAK